jgi:hypothetical protein
MEEISLIIISEKNKKIVPEKIMTLEKFIFYVKNHILQYLLNNIYAFIGCFIGWGPLK